MRLDGKVAVIVGAGQSVEGRDVGNGRATAIAFAREGARLLLADRDEKSVTETAELIAREGGSASVQVTDITDESACADLIAECCRQYGRIDVLHNNVGVAGSDGSLGTLDQEVWEQLMRINALGPAFTCKHALSVMRVQRSGSIINVSSLVSMMAVEPLVGYMMSKAALNSLTQHVAALGAPQGVRANTLLLGRIATPLAIEGAMRKRGVVDRKAFIEKRIAGVPLGHLGGTGWDVANAAVFLASDESRFITGIQLPVDGGQSGL